MSQRIALTKLYEKSFNKNIFYNNQEQFIWVQPKILNFKNDTPDVFLVKDENAALKIISFNFRFSFFAIFLLTPISILLIVLAYYFFPLISLYKENFTLYIFCGLLVIGVANLLILLVISWYYSKAQNKLEVEGLIQMLNGKAIILNYKLKLKMITPTFISLLIGIIVILFFISSRDQVVSTIIGILSPFILYFLFFQILELWKVHNLFNNELPINPKVRL